MPADANAQTDAATAGASVGAPDSSTFGAKEAADATRQAQQSRSDDSPSDVNCNAALARVQAGTYALMGGNFEASAMRFNGLMGHEAAVLASKT